MPYTDEQKKKLLKIYESVSTPEEKRSLSSELATKEALSVSRGSSQVIESLKDETEKSLDDIKLVVDSISEKVDRQATYIPAVTRKTSDSFSASSQNIIEKLDEVKSSIIVFSNKESSRSAEVSSLLKKYIESIKSSDVSPIIEKISKSIASTEEALSSLPTHLGRFPQNFGINDASLAAINPATKELQASILAAVLAISVPPAITNYALENGGNLASILSKLNSSIAVTGTVTADTELPAAAALADGVSSTAVEPRVAADMQGIRSDNSANSDRAVLSKMQDLNSGAGTEMVVGVTIRKAGPSGSLPDDGYPSGAVAVTSSSGNKANAAGTATLTAGASTTAYITGFECTSTGATVGLPVIVTVTGTISGTLSYIFAAPAGALLIATPLQVQFFPPIPASAVNTNIVVTLPALGAGNTNAAVVAHGYIL